MKNQSWFVLATVFVLPCQFTLALTTITWSVSDLAIESTAPPALVYVEDGQGRISGADPSQSTNSICEQVSELNGLENIPSSFVMQDNSSVVDDSGDVSPSQDTMWSNNIYDGGTQTYTNVGVGVNACLLVDPAYTLDGVKHAYYENEDDLISFDFYLKWNRLTPFTKVHFKNRENLR